MKFIYITEQGSIVRKTSRRVVISKNKKTLAEIPIIGLDGVLIFGNIQITSQAMAFLLDNGIQVSFLSTKGKYRGTLMPAQTKNVLLRIAQYERYLDEDFQREHASRLVEAKIRNERALIMRYSRNHPEIEFNNEISVLDSALEKTRENLSLPVLLGIEGHTSATYFRAYGKMFRKDLTFTTRSRRPPKDPVNALLSFGYTLITNEIFSLLIAIGFDPYIGYLHGIDYGRPSLALDMVEEFRHPIIDRLTLYIFNNQILTSQDFEESGDGGVSLKPDALKIYFENYEKRMDELFEDSFTKEKVSYRLLFRKQAHKLSKAIKTREAYEPYRME
jgi:CRISPR-associated protein Cas1